MQLEGATVSPSAAENSSVHRQRACLPSRLVRKRKHSGLGSGRSFRRNKIFLSANAGGQHDTWAKHAAGPTRYCPDGKSSARGSCPPLGTQERHLWVCRYPAGICIQKVSRNAAGRGVRGPRSSRMVLSPYQHKGFFSEKQKRGVLWSL